MNIKIQPSKIKGKINAIASKSFAHRILISAFLSGKRVKVYNVGDLPT